MKTIYKSYALIYLDKRGNELTRKVIQRRNITDARDTARLEFATTMLNDCVKITTKRIY